jgi:hypothetical protein
VVTCWVACPDRCALEDDTTVVLKCCWVKALSLPIQPGTCSATWSTWPASTEPIPAPSSTNSSKMTTSSRPVALPRRHPRRSCSQVTAGSSPNASSWARIR